MATHDSCLVVVDAWKNCEQEDLEQYPWLETETKLFGSFLNHQIKLISTNADIFYLSSGRELMDEIDTTFGKIITTIEDLPLYNTTYFCGFHLGRCIYNNIKRLKNNRYGVILNLSMVFPEDSYSHYFNKNIKNNYFYSYKDGFEKCNMN